MGTFFDFLLDIGMAVGALKGWKLLGMGQCIGAQMAIRAGQAPVGRGGKQVGRRIESRYPIGGAQKGLLPLRHAHHTRKSLGTHGRNGGIAMAAQASAVVFIGLERTIRWQLGAGRSKARGEEEAQNQ